jgi:hypothetical protein
VKQCMRLAGLADGDGMMGWRAERGCDALALVLSLVGVCAVKAVQGMCVWAGACL